MKIDLYKILGVSKNASAEDIHAAYRRRAKETHPDVNGGNASDEFHQVRMASVILSDPKRRDKYDRTGEVDDTPDNVEASRLSELIAMLDAAIKAAQSDPETVDLIQFVQNQLNQRRAELKRKIKSIKGVAEKYEAIAARFTRHKEGPNCIKAAFEAQADNVRRAAATLETELEDIAAIEALLQEYRFDAKKAPPQRSLYTSLGTASNTWT